MFVKDEAVIRYMDNLASSTRKITRSNLKSFFTWIDEEGGEFSGMSPAELVKWMKEHPGSYEVLDLIVKWVRSCENLTIKTQIVYMSRIKSFFRHNRAPIPADSTIKLRSDKPSVIGTLTVEEVKKVILSSKPMYQAIYISMFMGGMGAGELLSWSKNGLESLLDQLNRNSHHIRVDLPGRKKRKNLYPFHTWLGYDAVKALKNYLRERGTEPGPIFKTQYGKQLIYSALTQYWTRHLDSLGLIMDRPRKDEKCDIPNRTSYRTGKNLHEMRDLFRTRWEKSPANGLVAEFVMGHEIDSNGYNKAMRDQDYTLLEYMKAEPWLNILSDDPTVISVTELEKRDYELRKAFKESIENSITRDQVIIQLQREISELRSLVSSSS